MEDSRRIQTFAMLYMQTTDYAMLIKMEEYMKVCFRAIREGFCLHARCIVKYINDGIATNKVQDISKKLEK
uniref:Uncharacterized protein n=1 Tax=Onchocerca volvulus TaxID=6282 RepID=A0A8R1Y3M2_ONCVO